MVKIINSENGDTWYGFDLDGTLAIDDGWKGVDYIGEPIAETVTIAKKLHDQGRTVKIFTARVAEGSEEEKAHAREVVQAWAEKHLGFTPEVTCVKDPRMELCFDDRSRHVEKNTGKVLNSQQPQPDAANMSTQKAISYIEMLIGVDDDNALWLFEQYNGQIRSALGDRKFKDLERRIYAMNSKKIVTSNAVVANALKAKSEVATNAMTAFRQGDPLWVRGEGGGYKYQAKVYNEPSDYGIDGGRVSKLFIYEPRGAAVVEYDRGWGMRPKSPEVTKVYKEIMQKLKQLPKIKPF